ncbi:hypothetical protein B484DRAFT_478373 [Ochromonadaceae sp. CCMP2298]|nr:hypothetical protein B484DRAFT_478373 [Ochromonadaceae sp. CCMP2298]
MAQPVTYGPMSLQMGGVTSAVDDLVHGYETLVTSLPTLSRTVMSVHAETEEMAKSLQHRTRALVDGYEYLNGLSTQMPELLLEAAATHRATLQEAMQVMGPDAEGMASQQAALDRLRGELAAISHERVIMDVLTRPAINETKRLAVLALQAELITRQPDRDRGPRPPDRQGHIGRARGQTSLTSRRHGAGTGVDAVTGNATEIMAYAGAGSSNALVSDQALLSGHIQIPKYVPGRREPGTVSGPNGAGKGGTGAESDPVGLALTSMEAGQGAVLARAVSGRMVPSVRRGSLPEELQHLNTTPSPAITASAFDRSMRPKKQPKQLDKRIAQRMAQRMAQTDEEVAALRGELRTAQSMYGKQQGKAYDKLRSIVLALQHRNNDKDLALLAAVENIMKEALGTTGRRDARDAQREQEVLEALQYLLVKEANRKPPRPQAPPRPPVQEYRVLHAAPPLEPVVISVVVPDREPLAPVPAPAPAPVPAPVLAPALVPTPVPQVVVQEVVQVPGCERELIELMQSVVQAQQRTTQGNQALILSLIHERQTEPPPPLPPALPEPVALPEPAPEPEPLPEAVAEPEVEAEPDVEVEAEPEPEPFPSYLTALGEVVLGGLLLTGPYATLPAVVAAGDRPVLRPTLGQVKAQTVMLVQTQEAVDTGVAEAATPASSAGLVTTSAALTTVVTTTEVSDRLPVLRVPVAGASFSGTSNTALPRTLAHVLEAGGVRDASGEGAGAIGGAERVWTGGAGGAEGRGEPPHMRRVASAFTLRQLNRAPQMWTNAPVSPSPAFASVPTATSAAPTVGSTLTVPVSPVPSAPLTEELISQRVAEGVQLGLREALRLLKWGVEGRSRNDKRSNRSRINSTGGGGGEGVGVVYGPRDTHPTEGRRVIRWTSTQGDKGEMAVGGVRGVSGVVGSVGASGAGAVGGAGAGAGGNSDVIRDMEESRRLALSLLQKDECSDSLSLDADYVYQHQPKGGGDRSVSSLEDEGARPLLRTLQPSEAERRKRELFGEPGEDGQGPDVFLAEGSGGIGARRGGAGVAGEAWVPLVSRVMEQSATEEVLGGQIRDAGGFGDSTRRYRGGSGGSGNSDGDSDGGGGGDELWAVDANAPLVSPGPDPAMRLLQLGQMQGGLVRTRLGADARAVFDERGGGEGDDFSSLHSRMGASQSLASLATDSGDLDPAWGGTQEPLGPGVGGGAGGVGVNAATDGTGKPLLSAVDRPVRREVGGGYGDGVYGAYGQGTQGNRGESYAAGHRSVSASGSSSSVGSGVGGGVSGIPSGIPYYKQHRAYARARGEQSSSEYNADAGGGVLAAHHMLSVLEMHQPANYARADARRALANPILGYTGYRGRMGFNGRDSGASSGVDASASVDADSSLDFTGSSVDSSLAGGGRLLRVGGASGGKGGGSMRRAWK